MKICLDISPAIYRRAGIGRYTQELLTALLKEKDAIEFTAFSVEPTANAIEFDNLPRIRKKTSNKLWRLNVMGAYLARLRQDRLFQGVDIFHATDNMLPRLTGAKSVFTLYDLAFHIYPQTHTIYNRWFLKIMMPRFLKAADAVIAISDSTKRDAERFYGLNSDKINIVYPGVASQFKPIRDTNKWNAIRQTYRLPDRYILYVGSVEPRKNLTTLFEAFRHIKADNIKLVVVGRKGWRYKPIFEHLGGLKMDDRVIFTDFVSDEDLPVLYSNALAFFYPSLYEGFGLPVVEALACGTPVVASNASSLPEAAGDAAILLDPHDIQGWVQAIDGIRGNPTVNEEFRQKGLRHAESFSWDSAAGKVMAIYQKIYEDFHRSAYRN